MRRAQAIAAALLAVLVSGCVTTTTTVTKSVDRPLEVVGLNVLYVNAALTVSQGDNKGSTRPTVTADVNQLEGAVTRELPPKLTEKGIPSSIATHQTFGGGAPIKITEYFPLTSATNHLLILTPVAASESCKVQRFDNVRYDCLTSLTVSARIVPPGASVSVWESRLQEPRVKMCGNCASRFDGFVHDIANAVLQVVEKKPAELSAMPADQAKPDEFIFVGPRK